MANRYWVGGTGSWSSSNTTNWSTSSGGGGGASVPTISDDVFFTSLSNATSYTVTITSAATCLSLTMGAPASGAVTWAGSSSLNIRASMDLSGGTSGITRTYTGAITFSSTATGRTVTMNGVVLSGTVTFNGSGGGWTLQDTFSNGTRALNLTAGTLNTNGQSVTCGNFGSTGSTTRVLTLGASAISCRGWTISGSNVTLNANTSTITWSQVSSFGGGSLTYNALVITPGAAQASTGLISGSNTFASITSSGNGFIGLTAASNQTVTGAITLTGTSVAAPLTLVNSTGGTNATATNATITGNGTISLSNCVFQGITGAGSVSWTGTNIGNAGGNSGITFRTAANYYWVHGASASVDFFTGGYWATSSGGTPGSDAPLPQDTAIFDSSSFAASGKTVSANTASQFFPNISVTSGVVNSPTLNLANSIRCAGTSVTFNTGLALSGASGLVFSVLGSDSTLTTNGVTLPGAIQFTSVGNTLTLQDNVTASGLLSVLNGSVDLNNKNLTVTSVNASAAATITLTLGSGTVTLTGTGTVWDVTNGTKTISAGTSTIKVTDTSNTAITFAGNGKTYNNLWFDRAGSTATNTITGSNTFADFKDDGTAAHSVLFTSGTTQTVTTFTVAGSSGQLITLSSTASDLTATLSKASGTVTVTYVSLSDIHATGGATWDATSSTVTDVKGNAGWLFLSSGVYRQSKWGTVAANNGTGTDYSNVTNAEGVANAIEAATSSNTSKWAYLSSFGFSLPSTATIAGLQVIPTHIAPAGTVTVSATTFKAGTVATTPLTGQSLTAGSRTTTTYGTSTELWGETWAYSDVNASSFGAAMRMTGGASNQYSLDALRVTVYYTTFVISTYSVTHSLAYAVAVSPAPSKTLAYAIKMGVTLTNSLKYAVFSTASALTKNLTYSITTVPSALTKGLIYAIKTIPSALTKALTYDVKTTPSALTKGLIYAIKTVPSALTKSLQHMVKPAISITKSLTYTIFTVPTAMTKSLQYAVKPVIALTKSLAYAIKTVPSAITKSLAYAIKTVPTALTKSLQYTVKSAVSSLTKSLKYAVITTPAGTRLWEPSDASTGLLVWLKADAITGLVDGDPVNTWLDSSGLGNSAAKGAYNAPTYETNELNGLPVVRFSAAGSQALRVTYTSSGIHAGSATFIMARMTGGTNARLVGSIYPTNANWVLGWHNNGGDGWYAEGWVETMGGAAGTDWRQYTGITQAGGSSLFYKWGVLRMSNTNGIAGPNGALALSGYDGSGGTQELSDGEIAEVIEFSPGISSGDREKVEGYLAWKWGKQSELDSGHPYKSAAPLAGGGAYLQKSLEYVISTITTSSITKGLIYDIKTTPSAITKSLQYAVKPTVALTKTLVYDVKITAAAMTKGLVYAIKTVPTAASKSLQYAIKAGIALTKSLTYDVKSPVSVTKSLKYAIPTTLALTKSLIYSVRITPSALTKSLRYAVVPAVALTKSLVYDVKSAVSLTKSLYYSINASVSVTKSLKYVIRLAPITKSLVYDIKTSAAVIKSMSYSIFSHVNVMKSLKYAVANTGLSITKALRYAIVTSHRVVSYVDFDDPNTSFDDINVEYDGSSPGFALSYAIRSSIALVKPLTYEIKSPVSIAKSLVYGVETSTALVKSMVYDVKLARAITIALTYAVKPAVALTKTLAYAVRKPLSLTKGLVYDVRTTPAALMKALTYDVKTISSLTKSLAYRVRLAPITKSLTYEIKTVLSIAKTLVYKVKTNASLGKALTYDVRTIAALTKNLKYAVRIAPAAITRSLQYEIKTLVSITKSLTYDVRTSAAISKTLRYAISVGLPITNALHYEVRVPVSVSKTLRYVVTTPASITKSMKYAIVKAGIIGVSLRYVMRVNPYCPKPTPYGEANSPYEEKLSPLSPMYGIYTDATSPYIELVKKNC